jgi:sugar (pentulose or hexulose) kinase
MKLMGSFHPIKSDWHNCLKLGYDVRNTCWPDWIKNCLNDAGVSTPSDNDILGAVPTEVVSPGAPMGTISREMADRLGLQEGTVVVGGTTDSNAAFFAAAGTKPSFATAVTSLGSTTAIKLLSPQYIEDASRGVYSHRFPIFDGVDGSNDKKELWLVGGASNVGCVIFRTLNFSNDELESLSKNIDPMKDSPLSYYPLVMKGERFPVADPYKEPILDPVPESRQEYLHGLLQSIANVESGGFHVLGELGAPLPKLVLSCGGGAKNSMWTKMRQRLLAEALGVPDIQVKRAVNTEASFGAALLAAAMVALVTK